MKNPAWITTFSAKHFAWYGRVPITIALAVAIGSLVLLTAGIVFGVGMWLAQKNTFDLLGASAHQAITADVNQIEQYLQPAEHQAQFIARMISGGDIDIADREQFGKVLIGALGSVPQVSAIVFIDPQLKSFGAGRDTRLGQINFSVNDNSDDKVIQESMKAVLQGPLWAQPIWRDAFQKTYISRVHPVVLNDTFIGAVIVVVAVEQLSDFITTEVRNTTGGSFILYGQDHVLAHRLKVDGYPKRSVGFPLPSLEQFDDPVVSSIWQTQGRRKLGLNLPEGTDGHRLRVLGRNYAYTYTTLAGYGPKPMIVGTYFQASDRPEEIGRIVVALITGSTALLLSLVAAFFLGERIARPIIRNSFAAGRVRDLDVSNVEELPSSVFRELNDQSVTFNAMLKALRWFELYVPKKIVEQLIKHGNIQDSHSDARQVTVMVTDVVGFSTISEEMVAEEVAAFINHHFSMVVGCIEAEGGTVDKFMGDAVMAFWQDSETQAHSAGQACRAALAIANAIQCDNRTRLGQGDLPVGIRIGIHTGVATVGNIGAPGRLNYTIIGDTVNIGQRLEQLSKEIFSPDSNMSILISGETAQSLTSEFTPIAVGSHKLKGRAGNIDVYKLEH